MPEPSQDRRPGRAGLALYALASLLLFLAPVVRWQIADPDLWGRISVGAVLSQAGHLPRVDDFSYVARGARWIDHEWLSGVLFYRVLDGAGEAGLHLLKYALIAACFLLVFGLHRWVYRVRPAVAGLALIVLAPAGLVGFLATVRAQSLSFPLSLLFLTLLEAVRLGRIRAAHLAWLVPVAVFWGNAHGGVAMGLLALGVYGGSELVLGRPRRAALHLLTLAAAVLALAWLNPYGPAYIGFLLGAWGLERSRITEWDPLLAGGLGLHDAWPAAVAALALALSVLGTSTALRRRLAGVGGAPAHADPPPLAPALLLGLWLVMSLMAQRIVPFLALSLAALLPAFAQLPGLRRATRRLAAARWLRGRAVETVLPAVLAGLGLAALLGVCRSRPLLASVLPSERNAPPASTVLYPEGAVRYLRHSPFSGNLLNPFTQGEFLYWALYPRFRVASDGRYEEVYTARQFREVYDFFHSHRRRRPAATLAFADRSGADFVLFRNHWGNLEPLARSAGWRVVHRDEAFTLLARERVLAEHPEYTPPRPLPRGHAASIAHYFDDFERGARRFSSYP